MPTKRDEMDMLFGFIMSERFHYTDDDQNKFAIAFGPAVRYYGFLLIVLDRYQKASKKTVSILEKEKKLMPAQTNEPVRMTVEQVRLMEESSRLMKLVHLEIESFYLFAKIFLDDVARFLYVHFGQVNQLKGAGLQSHDNLAKYHKRYCEMKSLDVAKGLSESIMLLKERICDYRDKQIAHELSLRTLKATAWSASGDTRIAGGTLNPREGDRGATSEDLRQLMDAINTYIRQVFTLIETNREKSRLKLRARTTKIE